MNEIDRVVIRKIGKNQISITFPEGTKASIRESASLKELLGVIGGGDELQVKSIFRLSKPDPVPTI